MKLSYILLLCGLALVLGAGGVAVNFMQTAPDSGQVWIAVRAADKGFGQPDAEYYGSVDRKSFDAVANLSTTNGFLKLSHAAWVINGKYIPLSDSSFNGVSYDYANVVYLRVSTIYRIVELNDSFARAHSPTAR